MTTVLILLRDRFLSRISAFYFVWDFVPQLHSTYSYWILPTYICLIEKFHEVPLCRSWAFIVMLTWGDKLFKDLLANKIFSRQILSLNFKMKFGLNRGLVWKFLGWKLIILTALFCKIKISWILLKFWAKTRQQ